jgi:hypothetical protein
MEIRIVASFWWKVLKQAARETASNFKSALGSAFRTVVSVAAATVLVGGALAIDKVIGAVAALAIPLVPFCWKFISIPARDYGLRMKAADAEAVASEIQVAFDQGTGLLSRGIATDYVARGLQNGSIDVGNWIEEVMEWDRRTQAVVAKRGREEEFLYSSVAFPQKVIAESPAQNWIARREAAEFALRAKLEKLRLITGRAMRDSEPAVPGA